MKDTGGPAFAWTEYAECRHCGSWDVRPTNAHTSGMTMRDYLAAAALTGLLRDNPNRGTFAFYAAESYAFADAMLAERGKG